MSNAQKESASTAVTGGAQLTSLQHRHSTASPAPRLLSRLDNPRVDSRVMADYLGIKHKHAREQVQDYKDDFKELGLLRFETAKGTGGRPEKYVLLNEDQAYLLLAFSRNTKKVRSLKVALVKAFSEARQAAEHRQTQYLPTYHDLHDKAAEIGGSHIHKNLNRLINKAVQVESGQRRALPVPDQSLIVVYQTLALNAMQGATDERQAYARAKAAIQTAQGALGVQP